MFPQMIPQTFLQVFPQIFSQMCSRVLVLLGRGSPGLWFSRALVYLSPGSSGSWFYWVLVLQGPGSCSEVHVIFVLSSIILLLFVLCCENIPNGIGSHTGTHPVRTG